MDNLVLQSGRLVSTIDEAFGTAPWQVAAFWCQCTDRRDDLRAEICNRESTTCVVPLVLRGPGFEHPNSVHSDLLALISEHRLEIEQRVQTFANTPVEAVALLLISRAELRVPQMASPVALPSWFPVRGGEVTYVPVIDLAGRVAAPLNAPEGKLEQLCELLYTLNGALLTRIRAVAKQDVGRVVPLFNEIRMGEDPPANGAAVEEFLSQADAFHQSIKNPSGFRPGARDKSIISILLLVGNSRSPDALNKVGKLTATALGLSEDRVNPSAPSIVSVLLRSTNRDTTKLVQWGRNLITSVYAASQLVLAAAHADAYPSFPIVLIRSVSLDLRSSLTSIIDSIAGA
jgi:hypothetical protein